MNPPTIHFALLVSYTQGFARPLFALWLTLLLLPAPLVGAQAGAGAPAAAQSEAEARTLKLGEPVERELAGGQQHAYQITLSAGQYLNVVVEQRGLDVAVVLLGPDGKQLFEFDNERRIQGQETIWQVAEVSGSFRLTVRATQKGAPAGRYEIRLVELRAATEQDRTLQEARKLYTEGESLWRAGKNDEARPRIERSLEMREQILGTEHPDFTQSLHRLASTYSTTGDPTKVELLNQRALAIREKAVGPDHPAVADSLTNLGLFYKGKGDNAKAEPLLQRALVIREKALGPDHPIVADSLINLVSIDYDKGDYVKAELLYQRILTIREKALGPEHPFVVSSLNGLASIYNAKGDFAKAELLYQRALAIQEKVFGPDQPQLVSSLNSLANFYYLVKGDYAKAEPLYQRALAIREKAFGPDHPDVAASLDILGDLYFVKNDDTKAELLIQRAFAIREKALGPEHLDVAASLGNLARAYGAKGDYAKAEPLLQRALVIREKALGRDHPDVAVFITRLGELYLVKGNYAKAEPLFQRVLAILEKVIGREPFGLVDALDGLGDIYIAKGDYAKAEPLFQRALAIREKVLGPDHIITARSLGSLGNIYIAKGDYAKAEPLFQRGQAIVEKFLGPDHPEVALGLNFFARLYRAKGEFAQSLTFQSRANKVSERNLDLNLANGSERQKLAYLATFSGEFNRTVSLHVSDMPTSASACNLALTMILQRKGRALDAMTDSLATLRRRANAADRALLDQLQETNAQLARLVLNGPQRITPAEHQARIKSLEEQKEKLEADISHRSAEFRAQATPITIEAVQAAIPAQAAVVEFTRYRPFNPKYQKADERFGAPRYIAYVLHHQGEAQWVELGEAKAIDEAIEKLRQALRDKRRKDVKQLARAVDEKVMRPVRALLGQTRRVFISPDGALNLIPFAALVDERNRYLIQRYSFSYLTSGRDLLRLQVKQPNKQTALVVANPDFGEAAKVGAAQQRLLLTYRPGTKAATGEGAVLAGYYFPALQGTAGEARALKAMMPGATMLVQAQATETALKQISSPRILHIATHGFFLENQKPSAGEDRLLRPVSLGEPEPVVGQIENPLLRSGLALAGANRQKSDEADDGILTAQEAAGLDLWGTKLVVLSACDTGVGEVKNGEGVYGLRRALVLAGSETQVMSLWPVSDKATRDLMIEYYRRLLKGEGRSAALRQVQLQMLKASGAAADQQDRRLVHQSQQEKDGLSTAKSKRAKPKDYSHPYYWASFIQSGEWANLDGKR